MMVNPAQPDYKLGKRDSGSAILTHWLLTGGLLHQVQRGGAWVGWGPAQSPHRCTKCPPINGQCTNFMLFDVAQ